VFTVLSKLEKRGLAAFGCVFQPKKCLKGCKTRGFRIRGKAKTMYFSFEKAVCFNSLTAKWGKS
jgi:hypothetical protein